MKVIDAQVHLTTDIGVETSVTAMDAVGIDAVLIDEWAGFDSNGYSRPYRLLPNGAFRSIFPFSTEAVKRYPGRFAYIVRPDRRDPELQDLIVEVANNPHQVCLRISLREANGTIAAFEEGKYGTLLSAAESLNVPVMVLLSGGSLSLLKLIAQSFPGLTVVVDHCGIFSFGPKASLDKDFLFRDLVKEIGSYENVSIKLSHAPTLSELAFPFTDVASSVRRLVDAVGEQRVMWASDHTQTLRHHSWAEALMYLQIPGLFSDSEKEWIFARTARTALKWPASNSFGLYRPE